MYRSLALAVIWASLISASSAFSEDEVLVFSTQPLEVRGVQHAMLGPKEDRTVMFHKPGWVTDVEAYVTDAQGRRLDQSFLCHSSFGFGRLADSATPHFSVDEGVRRIHLPRGFGFPVRPDKLYRLDSMLQNADPHVDRLMKVVTQLTLHYDTASTPLQDLAEFTIGLDSSNYEKIDPSFPALWWLPPGQHRLTKLAPMPVDGRIHYIITHVHQYAKSVMISDPKTGQILFSGKTTEDAQRNLIDTPVYSSSRGFPTRAGQPLKLTVIYDVPKGPRVMAMANMHFFVHPDPGSHWAGHNESD